MLPLSLNRAQSFTDMAASLTDQALEIVAGPAARGDSVETELKLWRVLTAELKRELRDRGSAPVASAIRRVVNRAALRVIADRLPAQEYQALHSGPVSLCQV